MHRDSHFSSQKCSLSLAMASVEGDTGNGWRGLGTRPLVFEGFTRSSQLVFCQQLFMSLGQLFMTRP